MADIKIYGTLKNDTDEPIALASQIYDDTNEEYLDAPLSRIKPDLVKVTWAQLKALRDASGLVPGCWYRITDYTCTTTQEETQSAGNVYDILVLATDTGSLSEQARAIRHEGDTYFAGSNLDAWQVWYCLDNDAHRFLWADTTNGKGVVYRLIDEFGNDCPYDFKSIQFKRYKCGGFDFYSAGDYYSILDAEEYFAVSDSNATDFIWCYTFNAPALIATQEMMNAVEITGDIFREISDQVEDISQWVDFSDPVDVSLNTLKIYDKGRYDGSCRNNVMEKYVQAVFFDNVCHNVSVLNDIVLHADYDIGPHKGNQDYSTYDGAIRSHRGNRFSSNCRKITVGANSKDNCFAPDCYEIGLCTECRRNSFGFGCYNILLQTHNIESSFGVECWRIHTEEDCEKNRLGDNVRGIYLYTSSNYNVLEADCGAIDITGSHNAFRRRCYDLYLVGSYCVIHTGTKGTSESSKATLSRTPDNGTYEINYSMDPDGNIIQWTT